MVKNIILVGGPEDGRQLSVPNEQKIYTIVQPVKADGFKILLTSTQQGEYQQTGEYSHGFEIFAWKGWK
jgi:hypothetical protein